MLQPVSDEVEEIMCLGCIWPQLPWYKKLYFRARWFVKNDLPAVLFFGVLAWALWGHHTLVLALTLAGPFLTLAAVVYLLKDDAPKS